MISFSRRFISGLGGLRLFLLPLKRSRSGPESSRPSVCGGPHKWLPPDIPGGLGAERLPQCFTVCEQKGTLGGSFVSVMTQVVGIGVSVMPEYSPPCLLHRPSTKPRKTEMNDQAKTDEIIAELTVAYWMELETVVNYLANSTNLDGVRAEEIKKSLAADVTEELLHATQIAGRVKTIGGQIPGSTGFQSVQATLQPPADSTDLVTVIKGVIDAEQSAIDQYEKIIRLCDGYDFVTQDMCITLLADEQQHRREFVGFLKEYEQA